MKNSNILHWLTPEDRNMVAVTYEVTEADVNALLRNTPDVKPENQPMLNALFKLARQNKQAYLRQQKHLTAPTENPEATGG